LRPSHQAHLPPSCLRPSYFVLRRRFVLRNSSFVLCRRSRRIKRPQQRHIIVIHKPVVIKIPHRPIGVRHTRRIRGAGAAAAPGGERRDGALAGVVRGLDPRTTSGRPARNEQAGQQARPMPCDGIFLVGAVELELGTQRGTERELTAARQHRRT
jgi:hypothetical protein